LPLGLALTPCRSAEGSGGFYRFRTVDRRDDRDAAPFQKQGGIVFFAGEPFAVFRLETTGKGFVESGFYQKER